MHAPLRVRANFQPDWRRKAPATAHLLKRLAFLEKSLSAAVDCLLEARNNTTRAEWDFGDTNLRTLFRNATAIRRQRAAVLRMLAHARKEWTA